MIRVRAAPLENTSTAAEDDTISLSGDRRLFPPGNGDGRRSGAGKVQEVVSPSRASWQNAPLPKGHGAPHARRESPLAPDPSCRTTRRGRIEHPSPGGHDGTTLTANTPRPTGACASLVLSGPRVGRGGGRDLVHGPSGSPARRRMGGGLDPGAVRRGSGGIDPPVGPAAGGPAVTSALRRNGRDAGPRRTVCALPVACAGHLDDRDPCVRPRPAVDVADR